MGDSVLLPVGQNSRNFEEVLVVWSDLQVRHNCSHTVEGGVEKAKARSRETEEVALLMCV